MFAAWPLIAKIGAPLGALLVTGGLIAGGFYLYNESIRSEERAIIAAEMADKKDKQSEIALQAEREQHKNTIDVLERTMQEKDRLRKLWLQEQGKANAASTQITKLKTYVDARIGALPDQEVRYVEIEQSKEEPPCVVPPRITELVDRLARVRNAVPYSNRMPEDGRPATDFVIPGPGPATCAQLERRLEIYNDDLTNTLTGWRGLTEYVERERAINETFHAHQREIAE